MKTPTDLMEREELNKLAKELSKMLNERAQKTVGFGLVVFDFGSGGKLQWISNAERTDMIAALRELLGKWAADGSIQN